jgi:hypothetical protein
MDRSAEGQDMNVELINLTRKPIWIRVNTGEALCIDALSRVALAQSQVTTNAQVEGLIAAGALRRVEVEAAPVAAAPARTKGQGSSEGRTQSRDKD